jgi:hypothetical protein
MMIVLMTIVLASIIMCFVPMIVRMVFITMFVVIVMRRFGVLMGFEGLGRNALIEPRSFDHLALDAIIVTASAMAAVARTATVIGPVFALFLGLAMGAFLRLDQRLTVGNRDLVIVRMDFAEGEEAVAIAAIFDERGLQRRLYARDFGKVDIAAQLLALGGFEIKFFDAIAAHHDDPGLFRVGGID